MNSSSQLLRMWMFLFTMLDSLSCTVERVFDNLITPLATGQYEQPKVMLTVSVEWTATLISRPFIFHGQGNMWMSLLTGFLLYSRGIFDHMSLTSNFRYIM